MHVFADGTIQCTIPDFDNFEKFSYRPWFTQNLSIFRPSLEEEL